VTRQRKTARKLAFPSCASRTEILVRLAGIEPTTPWFVAKYSIQLSYSREALHYSMVLAIGVRQERDAQRKTARKLAFPSCVSRTEILVRLAGIEPTTPWFVAKYSIQLSYSREALHYGVQPGSRSRISEES
jgi:hypothetical protein